MTITTGNNIFSSVSAKTHPLKLLAENWHDWVRLFFGLLILAGFQLLLTMQLRMRYEPVADNSQHIVERIDPSLFRSLSFGQLPAAIDWVLLKCIQDPTSEHAKKGEHLQVYYDFDVLTELDPSFLNVYTLGANLLAVVHDDGEGALNLLLKGEKFRLNSLKDYPRSFRETYWDQEWQIPLILAYTYLFEIDDLPKAVLAYEEAAAFPRAPEYLRGLVKEFHSKDGQYQVGLRLLTFMINGQKDAVAREKLERRRTSLMVIQYLFDINNRFQDFLIQKKFPLQKMVGGEELHGMRSRLWRDFLVTNGISDADPWGGALSLNSDGKIVTSTEYQKVFGLE
jgi:hypothetical protein